MKRNHEPAETAEKTPAARPPSGEAGHGPERASSKTSASLPLAMATEQAAARRRRASEARRSRPRSPARMRAFATTSVIALVGVQLAAKHPAGIAGVHEDQRDQSDRAHEHKDLAAQGPPRSRPKSMMPRNPASRKKAVSTSWAINGRKTGPAMRRTPTNSSRTGRTSRCRTERPWQTRSRRPSPRGETG